MYAPALVSFVQGLASVVGLSNVAAWFPLGPREPYFPWYSSSDSYLREINVADLGTAIAIDRLIHPANVDAIAYVNRPVALTIVPTTVVVSGDPVAPVALHVPPGRLAKLAGLRIAAQPPGTPSAMLLAGGRPAGRPPVAARPRMIARGAPGNAFARAITPGRGAPPRHEAAGEVAAPVGRGKPGRSAPVPVQPMQPSRGRGSGPPAGRGAGGAPAGGKSPGRGKPAGGRGRGG